LNQTIYIAVNIHDWMMPAPREQALRKLWWRNRESNSTDSFIANDTRLLRPFPII